MNFNYEDHVRLRMAAKDWSALTRLTGGSSIEVERVRLVEEDVAIEGPFELPHLAQLSADDQIFVTAFVHCHGSIKQMEKYFGVSYPTVKSRLNRIGTQLPFVEVIPRADAFRARPIVNPVDELLSRLEQGELTARDVLDALDAHKEGDRS